MKKFLSMVMALAMTLTLVTVGASAKDFTDSSKITYSEAVNVISGIGVVDGYTDGSFNPTATLTRGAAAKIICNMLLGPTTASALGVTSAPFTDVPVSNVFAGYIAYCSSQGIINGYGDGTFHPAATVTGYQFMKMLLGALGYDGSIEGFTGTNWTVNVAKLAVSIGLDDGNDSFVGSKAMTREEAALYAFNTLQATMVEYANKGTTITVNGATITSAASKATDVENKGTQYDGSSDTTMQFCEQYFKTLKLSTTSTADKFGRPANVWLFGTPSKTIATAPKAPVLTYTTSIDGYAALAKDVANADYSFGTSVNFWTNGKEQVVKDVEGDTALTDALASTTSVGGNGCLAEVYTNSNGVVTDIVVVNTYLATVVGKTKDDTTTTSVDERALTLDLGSHTATAYASSKSATGAVTTEGFDAVYNAYVNAASGTTVYALVVPTNDNTADGVALSVAIPQTLTVTPTSYIASKSFVAGGTTYKYSYEMKSEQYVSSFSAQTIYLDNYGYVIGTSNNNSDLKYAYVTRVGSASDGWSTGDTKAELVMPDGTLTTVATGTSDYSALPGKVVTYTTDSNSDYTLVDATTAAVTDQSLSLKTGVASFTFGSALVANSKTVFVVGTTSGTTTTYAAYTGIANVPSMSGSSVSGVYAKDADGKFVTMVYLDNPTSVGTSSSDRVFVSPLGSSTIVTSSATYYSVKAVVNGTIQTLSLTTNPGIGVYTSMSTNADGYVTLGSSTGTAITKIAAASNGVIQINDTYYGYTTDCAVYTFDSSDGTLTASSVGSIATNASTSGWFTTNDDGVVTGIYVAD